MNEKLNNIERFFKYDLKIKEILHNTYPKEIYRYDKDSIWEYNTLLYNSVGDIEFYFNNIFSMFGNETEKQYARDLFIEYRDKIINAKYDFNKLESIYKECFANMNEELINKVGEECCGYYLGGVSLKEGKSINELLHIIHQTLTNSENLYKDIPLLEQKQNFEGYNITTYGMDNNISKLIYNNMPYELSMGDMDYYH